MKWVAASELGQLLLAQARGAGIAYVGARGIGYRSVGELSRIERPEFLPSVALLYEARKSPPASR
jgi:hypothetical protein